MDNLARILSLFVVAMLSLAAAAPASADSTARIIGTQPAAEAALGHQESFWVRIEYSSDEPMSLWARPYLNGVQVKKAFTNASWDYSGSGEALGWFALTEAGEVDEVRIFSGGGKPYRERELARQAVRLSWTNDIAAAVPQPAWVTELLALKRSAKRSKSSVAPANRLQSRTRYSSTGSCCW